MPKVPGKNPKKPDVKQEDLISRSELFRSWDRLSFKEEMVKQLVEKLAILPDSQTMDAVLQKAEYLTTGVHGEKR